MNSPRPRGTLLIFQVLVLLLLAGAFWALRSECLEAESSRVACLSVLDLPVLTFIDALKATFLGGKPYNFYNYSIYVAFGGIGLLSFLLLVTRSLPLWGFMYLVTLALACGGEFYALRSDVAVGLRFHLGAALTAFVSFALLWRKNREAISSRWLVPDIKGAVAPRLPEFLLLAAIFTLLILARFYQLNINPPAWDTESCGHRTVAASWILMLQQELEMLSQQSSGMSWTVLHHFFTRIDDPLLFDIDQRLLGVGISLLGCWAVYFSMRYLGGAYAGIFALVLYGFGPLDLHWSRLPTLHHLPVLVGILLVWASFAAFTRRGWGAFCALALLIATTKFVYPSAKLIALGPVLGMCAALTWEHREWIGHRRKFILVILGLFVFAMFRSFISVLRFDEFRLLAPFAQIQPVHNGNSLMTTVQLLGKEVLEFFRLLYFGPVIPSHYTMHATTLPLRALPSVSAVFVTLAFVHLLFMARRPLALLCVGLLIGGVVPAIVTGMEERRVSFVVVLVPLLALLEFIWFVDVLVAPRLPRVAKILKGVVLVLTTVCLWSYQTQSFFSRPGARPTQHIFNEELRKHIAPDTLVVNLSPEHDCSIFYGIYDLVRDSGGRIAYTTGYEVRQGQDPIVAPDIKTTTWHYRYTDLQRQVPTVTGRQDWPRKLYVLKGNGNTDEAKQRLRAQYPGGREILIEGPGIPPLTAVLFETAPPSRERIH